MPRGHDTQPIRVAFVLPSLAAGGAERVLITLMNGLERARFEPHFISIASDGPLRDLIAPDIPFYGLHGRKVSFALLRLWRTLRGIRPDIVVSTMAHMNFAVLLLKPFLPKHIRFIIREAVTPSYFGAMTKEGWIVPALYKWLYPKADMIISPAQAIIDEFSKKVGLDTQRCTLLVNPVSMDSIRGSCARLPARDPDTVQFVCAGRLHPQKGFDRLIESLPALNHPHPWYLTILGTGEQETTLQALIDKHGLNERVELAGFSKTPWPHVAAADCFLLPSRYEGLPNVVLEALTLGTPVIATKESGGIGEIAQRAGKPVRVVETMDDFIAAMREVTPAPPASIRPSLLPKDFYPEAVAERFMGLLDSVSQNHA